MAAQQKQRRGRVGCKHLTLCASFITACLFAGKEEWQHEEEGCNPDLAANVVNGVYKLKVGSLTVAVDFRAAYVF